MIQEMSYLQSTDAGAKPLVSARTKKIVLNGVVLVHISFILIPLLWSCIEFRIKPQPSDFFEVTLTTIPKISNTTNITTVNLPSGSPGLPEPVLPSINKVEVAEQIPPEPLVTMPKLPPEPRVFDLQKKVKQRIIQKRQAVEESARRDQDNKEFKPASSAELSQMINVRREGPSGYDKGRGAGQTVASQTGGGGRDTGEFTAQYEQALGVYLKQYWNTPEKRLLGSKLPEVTVQINITADGRIISYRLLNLSGNQLMDDSVEKLFMTVRQVLPPPNNLPREVTLIMAIGEYDK